MAKAKRTKQEPPTPFRWPKSEVELKEKAEKWMQKNERKLSHLIIKALKAFLK